MPKRITFIKSAVFPADFPQHAFSEIAIAGRSNAGKSSFINTLATSKVAKVSGTPGKTTLLNFFNVANSYVLVDMPGYGFAARSNKETKDWQQMIEVYLTERRQLKGLILVIDIRRDWTADEEALKTFCSSQMIPIGIVLTKADKLSRNHIFQAIQKMKKTSHQENVFACTTMDKKSVEEVEDSLYRTWIKDLPVMGETE